MRKTQLLRIDNDKNSLKYRELINTYLKIIKSQKTTKHGEFYNVSHRFASLNMRFLADMHTKKPIALFVTEK